MKVLQINSVCGIRSTGRICTDIAEILERDGNSCIIAYGRELVPEKYKRFSLRIGTDFDVNNHVMQTRIFDKNGFASKKATKAFLNQIDDYDPDIIHLHNIHGYYINIQLLFSYLKKSDKPIVWTFHDCWPFTGHCAYFDYIGCNKWKNEGCYQCPQKNKYPKSSFFDNSKNNFLIKRELFTDIKNLTIVTPSKWLAKLVEESFLSNYPVKIINNGIDLDIFKYKQNNFRERFNLLNKKIILGVASAWGKRKGLYDFFDLARMISDDFVIVLVGLEENQIKKYTNFNNIICIPKTNNTAELAEIYSSADVFINPTYEDNYPTVNLEAQACGTPVITYETGGSIESVPDSNIVKKGDINGLFNLIKSSDLQVMDRMLFDSNGRYAEYIQLYYSLLTS
ncbi:MAG: glycosyltransferase [Ruminococcus sp.]|nr:glycosyltransferase [Ruminococcus sp.]